MTDTAFAAPPVPAPAAGDRQDAPDVRACVAIARQTLRQAAEQGIPLPDATIDTVVGTERALIAGGLTAEQESSFWKAYAYVRANVATTTTLRQRYNIGFLALLIILMGAQALFISATSLIDGIRTEWGVVRDYNLNNEKICQQPADATAGTATTGETKAAAAAAHPAAQAASRSTPCPTRVVSEAEYKAAKIRLHSYDHLLESYGILLPGTTLNDADLSKSVSDQTLREYKHYVYLGALLNLRHFMELFILPALYGALGACAFVLRKFSSEVRDGTLTADAGIRYGLRISIGILSGLIIHWFIRPAEGGDPGAAATVGAAVQNLSRYALSFVAGYGSEIVFNILDRLVTALAPSHQGDGGSAATKPAAADAEKAAS